MLLDIELWKTVTAVEISVIPSKWLRLFLHNITFLSLLVHAFLCTQFHQTRFHLSVYIH